jgi:hypothetical protein
MTEVTTGRESTALEHIDLTHGEIVPAAAEPTLTLSQMTGLLREAAAWERARRPILLTMPDPYVPPAQRAADAQGGHPGITVNVPGPSGQAWAPPAEPLRRAAVRPVWALRATYACLAAFVAGAGACAWTDGAGSAVGLTGAAIVGALVSGATAIGQAGEGR